ncbi:hypothetical protein [Nocardioides sp. 1609]|uniref:hypothetical protein n=1 Tax=Nocardioides sp. 1609 TaxID=2508327 RepID=UPI00106F4F7F|nr:hypothetical protein [Nocardioides sp. 1609]
MLPSERRRQDEIARREADGESLWTTAFERRALVRIGEVWRRIARDVDVYASVGFSERVATILRLNGGWEFHQFGADSLVSSSDEVILDALAAASALMHGSPFPDRDLGGLFDTAVNNVMREHRIAYKFVDGELIPFESDELLQAAIEPALRLMAGPQFKSAHDAYLNALREISNGEPGDAITDAGTALQEALTALGCEGDVLSALIGDAKVKGLFKSHDAQLHEAMILVTKWAASERNKNSDAHKHPDASLADAWLMVHVVGALIVRLADPALRGEPTE